MKNEINAVLENMTTTIPEPEDYTGEDGLLYCGKCRKPKKPILRRIRPLSSGATATRQSATAREPPARNGKPPRNGKSTLTP